MSIKTPEKPKLVTIKVYDYVNNPKDPKKTMIKELPTPEQQPHYIQPFIWLSIIKILEKVASIEITPEKESEFTDTIKHRNSVLIQLDKLINEYISNVGIVQRHKDLSKKGKPCRCMTCTGNEIANLEENIKAATKLKDILDFKLEQLLDLSKDTKQKIQEYKEDVNDNSNYLY